MPSNIEERNDYAVRTLQALDQNINAKVGIFCKQHIFVLIFDVS